MTEDADREEWLAGIRRRLGLVTIEHGVPWVTVSREVFNKDGAFIRTDQVVPSEPPAEPGGWQLVSDQSIEWHDAGYVGQVQRAKAAER
jgi:hypothetical protein